MHGMNGKRVLLIVDPNSAKATRFVIADVAMANAFEEWLRLARHSYRRDTTVFRNLDKSTDEKVRCYKLLMDFRRAGGQPINLGDAS